MIHFRGVSVDLLSVRGWRTQIAIFLVLLAVFMTPSFLGAQDELEFEEEMERRLAGARQNPILREYFQEQYKFFNNTAGLEPNRAFREEYIDRRIDHFLEQIEEKLVTIHQLFEQATEHRAEALDPGNPEPKKARAVIRFEETLDELKGKADDLRDQLALVFRGLDHKRDLEEADPISDTSALYGAEMEFINDQLDKADTRIREYLFLTLNTVRWDDLQDQNMLVNLYWAQKMAEHAAKQLRDSR